METYQKLEYSRKLFQKFNTFRIFQKIANFELSYLDKIRNI